MTSSRYGRAAPLTLWTLSTLWRSQLGQSPKASRVSKVSEETARPWRLLPVAVPVPLSHLRVSPHLQHFHQHADGPRLEAREVGALSVPHDRPPLGQADDRGWD